MEARIAELIPRLRRYARALGNSAIPADELVRATLERASDELRLGQATADLRVWLFGLMHEAYVRSLTGNATPEAPAASFEQAIAALAPGQREVFLLVTLEDMSYEEVASALKVPVGTVMSRLSRAREKLRLGLMGQARLRAVK